MREGQRADESRVMVLFWGFLLAIFLLARPAIGGTDSWTTQDPDGRRIQAVATDPNSPGTAFVGNDKGEVMKTTTGGTVWLLTGEIPEKEITALTVDFHSAGFIYAGTPNGIYRSANQGTSWVGANVGLTNLSITALLDDLNTVNIVYAGTQGGGVFRSFDAGESWLTSPDTQGMIINGLAVDPFLAGEVYAATTTGLLISSDNGATWSPSNTGLLPTEMNISSIIASPHEPDVLFAAALNRIYKSIDGGATWARLPVAMPRIVTDLAIDPNPAMLRTIYAATAGSGIYKSSDGGLRWISFGPSPSLDSKAPFVNRTALDYSMPPIIFAGTEAGIFDHQYNFLPAAAFRMVPAGGSAPLKVVFQNTSTGYISQYRWRFGDGTSSSAVSPSHLFINPGAYRVTLTVTGPGGTSSKPYIVKVLTPAPPTVSIKATDTLAVEGSKNYAVFTVSRTGSTASALNVRYAIRGTAKNRVDYKPLSGKVTLPKGFSSVRIVVIARKDTVAEPNESINLLIKANSAYMVGLPKAAIAVIRSNR